MEKSSIRLALEAFIEFVKMATIVSTIVGISFILTYLVQELTK